MALLKPVDLTIDRGDSRSWPVSFLAQALDGTRTPLNLAGWTLDLFDVGEGIAGKASIAWDDAAGGDAAGKAILTLQSIPGLALYPASHPLRIRRTPPGGDTTKAEASPLIRIFAR